MILSGDMHLRIQLGSSIVPSESNAVPAASLSQNQQGSGLKIQTDLVELNTSVKNHNQTLYTRQGKPDTHEKLKEKERTPGFEGPRKPSEEDLTSEEIREMENLIQEDRDIRDHEMAHVSAGGGLVQGGPSYQFVKGPDGRMYAVGGEVSIDATEESSPEKTIRKMQRVKAAALAPSMPSSQDRLVAASATKKIQVARMELARQMHAESLPDLNTTHQDQQESGSQPLRGYQSTGKASSPVNPQNILYIIV